MHITKLQEGAVVFGRRISVGYKVLSSEANFYLYVTSGEDGPVECLLTSADHRELPLFFGAAIEKCGCSWDARVTAFFTYYISSGHKFREDSWADLEVAEMEHTINGLIDAITAAVAEYDNPEIPETDFPLDAILQDSLYYPSSATDGGIIKYCNEHLRDCHDRNVIHSFVYADYALEDGPARGDEALRMRLDDFRGYHVLFTKDLRPKDLLPQGKLYMPPGIDWGRYNSWRDIWSPFARWTVYELDDPDEDWEHGPERFSLLFIGGEGVATYSGLYLSRGTAPRALAIIQPGTGFGLNWTDYGDPDGPMADVVRHGWALPEYIFFGGMGRPDFYQDFRWPGYLPCGEIRPYRSDNYTGSVTIYEHNRNGFVGVADEIGDEHFAAFWQ